MVVSTAQRKMTGEVMSGGSYYSQNSFVLHFGLGKADTVDQLEIRWPNGAVQTWKSLAVNQKIVATEGSVQLRRVDQKNVAP